MRTGELDSHNHASDDGLDTNGAIASLEVVLAFHGTTSDGLDLGGARVLLCDIVVPNVADSFNDRGEEDERKEKGGDDGDDDEDGDHGCFSIAVCALVEVR